MPNNDLKTFLEKHSKLKHFESDYCFLWTNRDLLTQTNIRLDSLGIHFGRNPRVTPSFDQFLNCLKTLYARGFYKTLHLSFNGIAFEELTFKTISALPSIKSMHMLPLTLTTAYNVSRLTNLVEIKMYRSEG